VKRTPVRGVKENLKPRVYGLRKGYPLRGKRARPRAFCVMSRRVAVSGEVKALWAGAVGKPSPNRALKSLAADPKRHDLPMPRVKDG
jgi:hypothetical protein